MARTEPSYIRQRRREKVLNHARALARSGEHIDHHGILSCLAAREDVALIQKWFEDRAFCAQLDRLCAVARGVKPWN